MSTMSKEFAEKLIAGNGFLPGDEEEAPDNPPAVRVVEYTNAWGIQAYGVIFRGERDPLRYERETEYVRNPKLLWSRK